MIDLSAPATAAEFGRLVGISRQAASDLMARGVITSDQTAGAMVLSYCHHLRDVSASRGADGDLAFQRTELARVSRERNEIQLVKDRQEFANVDLLELVCTFVGESIASHLDGLPEAIASLCPALTDHELRHIRAQVAKAREIATNARLIDFENLDTTTDLLSDPTELDDKP